MSTADDAGLSAQHTQRKRRRSHKPDDGPVRQRRKVGNDTKNDMTNGNYVAPTSDPPQSAALAVRDPASVEPDLTTAKARRKRKHKAKKSVAEAAAVAAVAAVAAAIATAAASTELPTPKSQKPHAGAWQFGPPKGGRLITHDPLFSHDGQYLITATRQGLRVLSIQDSLLERTIVHPEDRIVSAYALSAVDPRHIYVSYKSDRGLHLWDWTTGDHVAQVHTTLETVIAIAVSMHPDGVNDTCWTVQRTAKGWQMTVDGRAQVFAQQDDDNKPILNLTADQDMAFATCGSTVVVASARYDAWEQDHDNEDPPRTTCVEYKTAADITCLAPRLITTSAGPKKAKKARSSLSIAAGNVNGEIFLYDNVSITGDSALSPPRTLHWHREAVGTVKWSKDGNYLISGGRETVLVLWQLTTGNRQYLPHLAAEIECVTVSPSGAAYAILLADNSVMVLSTSELVPIANFPGFQAVMASQTVTPSNTPSEVASILGQSTSAATTTIHPFRHNEVLVAVPPSMPSTDSTTQRRPKPFLQTFDVNLDRHISRQALSRNKLTDFTTGPDGNVIQEPNTTHVRLSHDGKWMVTVEAWTPPSRDIEYLAANDIINREQRKMRTEVYLKFWQWSDQKNCWVLETRIDNPHPIGIDDCPGRVFDLVSDPIETSFSTLGEDACVRVWRPQTRRRNGLVTEGQDDWKAKHVVSIEQEWDPEELSVVSGTLAYSADGSLLAVHLAPMTQTNPSTVRFLNVSTGDLLEPQSGIYTGKLASLGFVGRYLIILSNTSISVWDVVAGTLTHRTKLEDQKGTRHDALICQPRLLALSTDSKCFAVTVPASQGTRVLVYQPSPFQKLCDKVIDNFVTAILTVPGKRKFLLVLASAEIVALEQTPEAVLLDSSTPMRPSEPRVVDKSTDVSVQDSESDQESIVDYEGDGPDAKLVRAETLNEIFEGASGQGTLNMPVSAMFEAVAGLFAGRNDA